jgi:hypothetical protein
MKKIVLVTSVALLCFGFVGCKAESSGEYTYTLEVPVSLAETEGDVTTTTEWEWNTDGSMAGQKQMRGAELVYEDSNYEYEAGKITYNRSYFENSQLSKVVSIEDRYKYANWTGRYSRKIYSEDGKTLLERDENIYTNQVLSEYIHEKEDVTLLRRTDYEYDSNSISYVESGSTIEGRQQVKIRYLYYDYGDIDEIVTTVYGSSDQILTRKKYSYTQAGVPQGYKVYRGDTQNVIEEQTDYKIDGDKVSYTTTWYDDAGTQTRQLKTVQTYELLSIKVVY